MDRKEFNDCMKPYMTGEDLAPDDRKERFCIGAKLCAGKASSETEAARLCAMPREPKTPKVSRQKSVTCNYEALAACAAPKINLLEEITPIALLEILSGCSGVQKVVKLTREKFIKKCFKEHSTDGTTQVSPQEAAKLRTLCIAEYKTLGLEK